MPCISERNFISCVANLCIGTIQQSSKDTLATVTLQLCAWVLFELQELVLPRLVKGIWRSCVACSKSALS